MSTLQLKINDNCIETLTYTVSQSATQTTVTINSIKGTSASGLGQAYRHQVAGGLGNPSNPDVAFASLVDTTTGAKTWNHSLSDYAMTINKTHSATTKNFGAIYQLIAKSDGYERHVEKDVSISVPAKTSYKITFSANGGSGGPTSQTKWHGETLLLTTSKPTKTGYTFQNWKATNGTLYSSGKEYSANAATTMTAQWKIITYTITYNANGGSNPPSSQTKNYGTSVTIKSTAPTKDGYNFLGWYDNKNGTGTNYAGQTYSTNANLTLYAKWQLKTYSVAFSATGASNIPSTQTKTHGTSLTLSSTVPTKTNYVFKNWKATDGQTYNSGNSYTKDAGTTLTAQWYDPYSVTFDANGGSGAPNALTKPYYDSSHTSNYVTIPSSGPSGSKQDCAFDGWYANALGTGTNYAGTQYTANANLNLYAKWVKAYESPTVSISNIFRADSNGDPDDEGIYLGLECSYYVYDTGSNSFTWSATCNDVTVTTPLDGGTTKAGTVKFLIAANLSTQQSYSATVTLTDDAVGAPNPHSDSSASQTKSIGTAIYPIDIGMFNDGYGIALNGVATRKALDILFSDTHFGNLSTTGINLYSKTQTRNQPFIRIKPYDANANGLIIGDGGLTLIGGGESANNLYNEIIGSLSGGEGTERLYLCSDNEIYFNTNCNTIANRKECYIDNNGDFVDFSGKQTLSVISNQDAVTIGTSSNNGVTVNTQIGNVRLYDAHGTQAAIFGSRTGTAGDIWAYIGAFNKQTDGTSVSNYIQCIANKDGTASYSITDKAAFRRAIDLADSNGDTFTPKGYGTYYKNAELTLTTSAQKIALTSFNGYGMSATSNGIKVAKAGTYLVIGSAYFHSGFTANDIVHLIIAKNGTYICDSILRMYTASPYQIVQDSTIVTCAANDVFYLYAYNQTAARGKIASRDGHGLSVIRLA